MELHQPLAMGHYITAYLAWLLRRNSKPNGNTLVNNENIDVILPNGTIMFGEGKGVYLDETQ